MAGTCWAGSGCERESRMGCVTGADPGPGGGRDRRGRVRVLAFHAHPTLLLPHLREYHQTPDDAASAGGWQGAPRAHTRADAGLGPGSSDCVAGRVRGLGVALGDVLNASTYAGKHRERPPGLGETAT